MPSLPTNQQGDSFDWRKKKSTHLANWEINTCCNMQKLQRDASSLPKSSRRTSKDVLQQRSRQLDSKLWSSSRSEHTALPFSPLLHCNPIYFRSWSFADAGRVIPDRIRASWTLSFETTGAEVAPLQERLKRLVGFHWEALSWRVEAGGNCACRGHLSRSKVTACFESDLLSAYATTSILIVTSVT